MKRDDATYARLLEYIRDIDGSGARFDNDADRAEAMYPNMKKSNETTQSKIRVSRTERDFYLDLFFENNHVLGKRWKNGYSGLKLTSKGHDWLDEYARHQGSQTYKSISIKLVKWVRDNILANVITGVIMLIIGYILGDLYGFSG